MVWTFKTYFLYLINFFVLEAEKVGRDVILDVISVGLIEIKRI